MDLGIAGKSVFFTGGSTGIGRIAARMLADEGAKVAIVARTQAGVDSAVAETPTPVVQPSASRPTSRTVMTSSEP